jgi:hypothetical protein
MSDRQNTLVCCFDPKSPRKTAFHIHEWIQLAEEDVRVIHLDGLRRRVYIKFTTSTRMQTVPQVKKGWIEFKHDNGELSQVTIGLAGMGMKKVRIANLPSEGPDRTLRYTLTPNGEVRYIKEEQWTRAYRHQVSNGIRIVEMNLRQHLQHLPSHMTIASNRVLVSYDGQPSTYYGCGDTGQHYPDSPRRKHVMTNDTVALPSTWVDIVTRTAKNTHLDEDQTTIHKTHGVESGTSDITRHTEPTHKHSSPTRARTNQCTGYGGTSGRDHIGENYQ